MKIIDNNGLNHVVGNGIHLTESYFITPDVKEEFEVQHDKLPQNVRPILEEEWFDGATYLINYQTVLNRRDDRSFYNMTGFGDVSIIAVMMTLKSSCAGMLPAMIEDHIVITGDTGVIRQISGEFNDTTHEFDQKVHIVQPQDYAW
jgi:hypothetical protein